MNTLALRESWREGREGFLAEVQVGQVVWTIVGHSSPSSFRILPLYKYCALSLGKNVLCHKENAPVGPLQHSFLWKITTITQSALVHIITACYTVSKAFRSLLVIMILLTVNFVDF